LTKEEAAPDRAGETEALPGNRPPVAELALPGGHASESRHRGHGTSRRARVRPHRMARTAWRAHGATDDHRRNP